MIDFLNKSIIVNNSVIKFSEIMIIEGFYFRLEIDEIGEEHFNADIFFIATQNDVNIPLKIKFYDVSDLKINRNGRQIMGFDILDMKQHGWSNDNRYHFMDYEDGVIEFYCSDMVIA